MKYLDEYLAEWCEPHPTLDAEFSKFSDKYDSNTVVGWPGMMEKYLDSIKATGMYGTESPIIGNTNFDGPEFDTHFEWTYWEDNGESYVAIRRQQRKGHLLRGYSWYEFYHACPEFVEYLDRPDRPIYDSDYAL